MKILVNVIKWKSACLLLFLFSKVELEIESVIHEFRLSELLQFTTVFLGRTSETFRTVHETGDTVHLQNLILIRGCHVLQVIRDELRAHTILDQSDYLKREGDRREGLIVTPPIMIRPFLQASAAIVRVLKIRVAHIHLSIRTSFISVFSVSFYLLLN